MDVKIRMFLAELFGTFLVVLVGAGTVCSAFLPGSDSRFATVGGITLGVALAEGIALAIAVSFTARFSVGCCNPAITLTLFVARKIDPGRMLGLIAMQMLGAFLAGLTLRGIYPDHVLVEAHLGAPYLRPVLAPNGQPTFAGLALGVALEALFALIVTTAAFATLLDQRAPRLGGLGLGLAQTAVVLFGFHLTGGSANPARWFGPAIWQLSLSLPADSRPLAAHPVYWLGPILGALTAGVFYVLVILPPEKE
jgi:glycerol uptake facilitator-like aquaporin